MQRFLLLALLCALAASVVAVEENEAPMLLSTTEPLLVENVETAPSAEMVDEAEDVAAADEESDAGDSLDNEDDDDIESEMGEHDAAIKASSMRLEKVLVKMYGVPSSTLQEFGQEIESIKNKLRVAYTQMKEARNTLARKLRKVNLKTETVKRQVRELTDRIRRLKRRAVEDAKKRAERLRKQLRARIRAHRAGLEFVRKLREQVRDLKESYKANFSKKVADIQSLLLEYADDVKAWTGHDVTSDVQKNRDIGVQSGSKRLYTKKHLTRIVGRLVSKLRAAYVAAKEALRRANSPVPNPHIGRLEMLLNGLKAKLSKLQLKESSLATALNKIENGHPSLRHIRGEFTKIKAIENQIYTQQRVMVPQVRRKPTSCVQKVKKHYKRFDACRKNLRKAVSKKAPKGRTYVLWKQYVVAKNTLRKRVVGCAKEVQMEEEALMQSS